MRLIAPYDMSTGFFHALDNNRYITVWAPVYKGADIELIDYPVQCLFRVAAARINQKVVGMVFSSSFPTVNGGGYLIAKMGSWKKLEEAQLLLRADHVSLYTFPNQAALAVTAQMNRAMKTIMEEQ